MCGTRIKGIFPKKNKKNRNANYVMPPTHMRLLSCVCNFTAVGLMVSFSVVVVVVVVVVSHWIDVC